MKQFYILLFSIFSVLGFSQTILDKPETTTRTVQDPTAVILTNGFRAIASSSNPFIAKVGPATENAGGGTDNSTAKPSVTSSSSDGYEDTQGSISVGSLGQLQFSLPFDVPSGIKNVSPKISLVYTGAISGVAGYGMGLSGISSINRAGNTIEQDGITREIKLDYTDKYKLDGERLVAVNGDYGKDNTEYKTEYYSNLKVKSYGADSNSPKYFEVSYPDGSKAWYGEFSSNDRNARTPIQYNIVKWRDANGNYITYSYNQENNVSVIAEISWGRNESNTSLPISTLKFSYENKNLMESAYIGDQQFIYKDLLKSIVVTDISGKKKTYTINHTVDDKGSDYQYVNTMTESVGSNNEGMANPIIFDKDVLPTGVGYNLKTYNQINTNQLVGDFDGDGKLDLLFYNGGSQGFYECVKYDEYGHCEQEGNYIEGVAGGSFIIFNKFEKASDAVKVSSENLTKGTIVDGIVDNQNHYINGHSIVLKDLNYQEPLSTRKLKLTFYSLENKNMVVSKSMEIPASNFDKTGFIPENPDPNSYYQSVSSSIALNDMKTGDLDGDGVPELIFTVINLYNEYPSKNTGGSNGEEDAGCSTPDCNFTQYENYVINTNSNLPSNFSRIGYGKPINKAVIVDMNGDGKADIIDKSTNYFYVYSDFELQNDTYESQNTYSVSFNGEVQGLLFGDFNGDGKTDFVVPEKGVDQTDTWRLYINKGKTSFKEQLLPNYNIFRKGVLSQSNQAITYTNIVKDINGDGKDDLLSITSTVGKVFNRTSTLNVKATVANGVDIAGNILFKKNLYTNDYYTESNAPFSSVSYPDELKKFDSNLMVKNGNDKLMVFYFPSVNLNSKPKSIKIGTVTSFITYNDSDEDDVDKIYDNNIKPVFPYVNLKHLSYHFAVTKLWADQKIQEFRYRNLIVHLTGRGMIGFNQNAESSVYANGYENTKTWSVSESDYNLNNATTKSWLIKTDKDNNVIFSNDINVNSQNSNLISAKFFEYANGRQVLSNGTKVISLTKSISKDYRKNVKEEVQNVQFNQYFLPIQTTTNINDGFATTTTDYVYDNVDNGTDYYIGRIKSKEVTVSAYGDSKTNTEEYTYDKNLLKKLITYPYASPIKPSENIETNYEYDGFGNIASKQVVSSKNNFSNSLKEQYEFDTTGRFVKQKIDASANKTLYEYDAWGRLTKITDPLENTIVNTYDDWGKQQTSKSNLAGESVYVYTRENGSSDRYVSLYTPDGNVKETQLDKFGHQVRNKTKTLNSQFVYNATYYDLLGRNTGSVLPFKDGEPQSTVTITYDDYSRATKTVNNTSQKTTEVEYDDSNRSVKTTEVNTKNGGTADRFKKQVFDPLGNLSSSEDNGGIITYNYNALGQIVETNYKSYKVQMSYDIWGRKVSHNDPSNGLFEYKYNALDLVIEENNRKGTKTFEYDNLGKLTRQTQKSNNGLSDKEINYRYNAVGQLTDKYGTSDKKAYSSTVTYDSNGRTLSASESSNGKYFMQKDIKYDDKMRISSYAKSLYSGGIYTKALIENKYDDWSGILTQIIDRVSGNTLWEVDDATAIGQLTKGKLGGITILEQYDANNYISFSDRTNVNLNKKVLSLSYNFNPVSNNLTSRSRGGDNFSITENFTYDDANRLVTWQAIDGATAGSVFKNTYDLEGRITENDQVGKIKYDISGQKYRPSSVELNSDGDQNYAGNLTQKISYNENNDAVFIEGEKGDVGFTYGLTNMRQTATYGGKFGQGQEGNFTKYYSEDAGFEIVKDNQTGQEKHIIYIGGTSYDSNIVYLKNYTESSGSYKFLHKDYLGSILAITDEAGSIVEENHFDAWGQLTKGTTALLGRGYTGHEHFAEVGIIHMNGRLYDPLLRRFINPDPFIQDGTNTQNYNKYAYVLNNPLMYTDFSGYTITPGSDGDTFEDADAKILFDYLKAGGGLANVKDRIQSYFGNNGTGTSTSFSSGFWAGFDGGGFMSTPTIASNGNLVWWTKSGGDRQDYGFNNFTSEYNSDIGVVSSHIIKNYVLNENRSKFHEAIENSQTAQKIESFEKFLFIELPASFAGGELLSAGWRAAGVGKYLGQAFNYITKGGPTFAEYRAAYWAKNIKPVLDPLIDRETGQVWKQYMELHHRFIPQRASWAPNWLLNNRFNLQPLSSLEHAIQDPYRARFAPKWVKEVYNLTWK